MPDWRTSSAFQLIPIQEKRTQTIKPSSFDKLSKIKSKAFNLGKFL